MRKRLPSPRPAIAALSVLAAGPASLRADDDLCGCAIGKATLLTPGTATCEVVGASTIISLSDPTIIEWDSFALRSGSELRFQFDRPTDTVVNRSLGSTFVAGTLVSNGNVVLLGPNGLMGFTRTARVTAGSFTASGLDADPAQFLDATSGIEFQATAGGGAVTTIGGEITTTRGGVTLVGRELHLTARIDAAGPVTAITGDQVSLNTRAPRQSTPSGGRQIIQGGTIDAGGDLTFISQNAISMTGRLSAGGGRGRIFVKVDDGGRILTGAAGLELRAGQVRFSERPTGELAFIGGDEGDDASGLAPAFNEFPSRRIDGDSATRTVPTSSPVVARAGSGFSRSDEDRGKRRASSPPRDLAGNGNEGPRRLGSMVKRSFFQTRTTVTPPQDGRR